MNFNLIGGVVNAELMAFALKYLNFSDLQNRLFNSYHIDYRQCEILRFVFRSYSKQQSIKISDVLSLQEIASQATIHKIVHELIKVNLLKSESDPNDERVKYLTPTPASLELFSELGKEMK